MDTIKSTSCCDDCQHKNVCREIYVLKEILRDELSYTTDPKIAERIAAALNLLERVRYQYPFADLRCKLADDDEVDENVRMKMQALLLEIRAQAKASS